MSSSELRKACSLHLLICKHLLPLQRHGTARPGAAQHGTVEHSTAQHNPMPSHPCDLPCLQQRSLWLLCGPLIVTYLPNRIDGTWPHEVILGRTLEYLHVSPTLQWQAELKTGGAPRAVCGHSSSFHPVATLIDWKETPSTVRRARPTSHPFRSFTKSTQELNLKDVYQFSRVSDFSSTGQRQHIAITSSHGTTVCLRNYEENLNPTTIGSTYRYSTGTS